MKVITVAQQKGGAGKTTVSAHLAVALSQKGRRVGVIDVDPIIRTPFEQSIDFDRLGTPAA